MILQSIFKKGRRGAGQVIGIVRNFYNTSILISSKESEFSDYLRELKQEYKYQDKTNQSILLVPLINDVASMRIIMKLAYKLASEKELNIHFFMSILVLIPR